MRVVVVTRLARERETVRVGAERQRHGDGLGVTVKLVHRDRPPPGCPESAARCGCTAGAALRSAARQAGLLNTFDGSGTAKRRGRAAQRQRPRARD